MARLWLQRWGECGVQQPLDVSGSPTHKCSRNPHSATALSLSPALWRPGVLSRRDLHSSKSSFFYYAVLELLHVAVKHARFKPPIAETPSEQVKTQSSFLFDLPFCRLCVLSVLMCFDFRLLRCAWFPCHLEPHLMGSCQRGSVMHVASDDVIICRSLRSVWCFCAYGVCTPTVCLFQGGLSCSDKMIFLLCWCFLVSCCCDWKGSN